MNKKTIQLVVVSALISSLFAASSFALPGGRPEGKEGKGGKEEKELRDPNKGGANRLETDKIEGQQAEVQVLNAFGNNFSRSQIIEVLGELKGNKSERQSLVRVLKNASQADADTLSLLRAYVGFLVAVKGEFHLPPSVLELRAQNWSPLAKKNIGIIMKEASELAKENFTGNRDQAFYAALKRRGIDKDYEAKCRKPLPGRI